MKYPLMRNNILRSDLDNVIEYLRSEDPKLTNGMNVRLFEEEWSEWLGVKHSVFVNSGASANLLTMTVLKNSYPEGGSVIVPPLTWVSDISAVLQNGFRPIFADIDLSTLSMSTERVIEALEDDTRAVFMTHAQGFNGISDKLLSELERRGIPLIEDVCEAHGATHAGKRLGSFGLMSNFSFYYAHHMSTIEGGMICTNDSDIYQTLRMLRAHGMVRESTDLMLMERFKTDYPDLNPEFIFAYSAYNVRNTEIGGIIGRAQLKNLDSNVLLRTRNFRLFLSLLNPDKYFTDFALEGSSNYALNIISRKPDLDFMNRLTQALKANEIEYRRGSAGGGNQTRQPYLKSILPRNHYKNFPNTDFVHFYGLYIGNFPTLSVNDVRDICSIINSVE